ncbi:hypothetical protein [Enterococcus hirae]|uniref:hypothetical protein n=1 Tax=Enterococcus hirae TaxID=1354 RepID=UPI0027C134AA|nr:hypothetical protein [Enterococcus hirae]MDQ2183238.1 hypothetical protein [Enterococcus hirae]
MNIIQQYELRYITFDQLLEDIWGYGQRLINDVGVDCFSFYISASSNYHNNQYYIYPYER